MITKLGKEMIFGACFILLWTGTVSARDMSIAEVMKHVTRLESTIGFLEQKHSVEIEALEKRISHREAEFRSQIRNLVSTKTKLRSEDTGASDQGTAQTKRAASAHHVAFSAYMEQDADFQGTGQTMVFNHVLLNDGQAYSKYTGIFTAPLDGVYSFTFFIGERDENQAFVRLYHNSVTTVSAVVETDNINEDAQGGNTAILALRTGDVIYLKNELSGDHVEGSNKYSSTTFSGFLLYPSQPGGVSVVG